MAGTGGYQPPASPAPVSGPGPLSRRTDGQASRYVSGLPYGDGQELLTQQGAAPMSGSTTGVVGGEAPAVPLPAMTTDLYAPSGRPNEPVTSGVDTGPGPGSEALGPQRVPDGPSKERLMAILPILSRAAEQPYASTELRAIVSLLRSANG